MRALCSCFNSLDIVVGIEGVKVLAGWTLFFVEEGGVFNEPAVVSAEVFRESHSYHSSAKMAGQR